MPELSRGVVVPLFDRLAADGPSSDRNQEVSVAAMRGSIARELHRLFNTRRPSGAALVAGLPATVLDYGIPDFSAMYIGNTLDHEALATGLADAISWFEPRLANPAVRITPPRTPGGPMVAAVAGDLVIGTRVQRVEFDMDL